MWKDVVEDVNAVVWSWIDSMRRVLGCWSNRLHEATSLFDKSRIWCILVKHVHPARLVSQLDHPTDPARVFLCGCEASNFWTRRCGRDRQVLWWIVVRRVRSSHAPRGSHPRQVLRSLSPARDRAVIFYRTHSNSHIQHFRFRSIFQSSFTFIRPPIPSPSTPARQLCRIDGLQHDEPSKHRPHPVALSLSPSSR